MLLHDDGAVQGRDLRHGRHLPEESLLQPAAARGDARRGAGSRARACTGEKEKEELRSAHSAADSTGRTRDDASRGPQRVRITLVQESVPSTTMDDAASTKKLCALAPCVVSQ